MEKEIDDLASSLVDKILQSYITEANSSPLSSVGNYNDSDQEAKKSLTTGVLLPGRKRFSALLNSGQLILLRSIPEIEVAGRYCIKYSDTI